MELGQSSMYTRGVREVAMSAERSVDGGSSPSYTWKFKRLLFARKGHLIAKVMDIQIDSWKYIPFLTLIPEKLKLVIMEILFGS